jgi:hypothetical protein
VFVSRTCGVGQFPVPVGFGSATGPGQRRGRSTKIKQNQPGVL